MISAGTNVTALSVLNQTRLNAIEFNKKIETLATGLKVNRSADDPSGIGITTGSIMTARTRGLFTNIQNVQEGIDMLNYVDGVFGVTHNILFRMRDISVRLANEATLTTAPSPAPVDTASSSVELYNEFYELKDLLEKFFKDYNLDLLGNKIYKDPHIKWNNKPILSATPPQEHLPVGEDLQVGPNSGDENKINVQVMAMSSLFEDIPDKWDPALDWNLLSTYVGFAQDQITNIDDKISQVNDARASVGIIVGRLQKALDDIQVEYINITAAKSRILDADMAKEIADFSKVQIKTKTNEAVMSQATAIPLIAVPLLQAIYDGLAAPPALSGEEQE
ncbi:MAG: flagellin [bacterium]